MSGHQFQVGDRVVWLDTARREHPRSLPATVIKIGRYITIELDDLFPNGNPNRTAVTPRHLTRLESPQP